MNVQDYTKEEVFKRLYHDTVKFSNEGGREKHFWYEVFIDFDEAFDEEIYPRIKNLEYEDALTYSIGWMAQMDRYYDSPQHYESLNKALENMVELK